MKKIVLLLAFVSFACSSPKEKIQDAVTGDKYQVSQNHIEETVAYLASDALKGRKLGTEGIEKAAVYLEKNLRENGLKPYYETFRDSFPYEDQTGYNIVAYKEGSDPELKNQLVVLGAHYDHIGIVNPVSGDSIANGANDDASGVAAILELAKYFAHRDTKRSMLFCFFSGEEEGLIGSSHLAKRLNQENKNLYAMLNYEMIGVPLVNKDYTAYLSGYELSNFADKFNQCAGKEVLGFLPMAKNYQLFKRSDNYAFYEEMKIPAQTLSTFDFTNFDFYHKPGDETELMDFGHMEELIKETIPGIEQMAETSSKEIKMNTQNE